MLNWEKMLSVNKKKMNCYVTQKIGIGLRKVEKYLIDKFL